MATEPSETVEALRNLMLTLMREYQAAIDAALAAERAGDPLRAHDRAIAMDALGEVITTLLTALDALPAMRGSLDQSIQEWHGIRAQERRDVGALCASGSTDSPARHDPARSDRPRGRALRSG